MRLAGDLPEPLAHYVGEASERLERGAIRLWAKVDDDVWREIIARTVARRLGCEILRVPDTSNPDAVIHVLAQVLGANALTSLSDLGSAIKRSTLTLIELGRPVVVLGGRQARDADAAAALSPAQVEFELLLDAWSSQVPCLLWLAPHNAPPEWRGRFHPRFELAMHLDAWAACLEHAIPAALAGITDRPLSPTQLSAVAGLLSLGREDRARDAVQQLYVVDTDTGPSTIAPEELTAEQSEGLALASALRMPLQRDRLPDRARRSGVFDALSWETDLGVFVPQRLRAWARPARRFQSTAHDALAAAHQSLDGARDPLAEPTSVFHWIEKVHHLARGTDASIREWEAQRLPSPAFYWDRGRHLSLSKKFFEAAQIFERCLERFPDDPYALHYHAFNLERAGLQREVAERHYREAIARDPGNVWFHRRLVTFYIGLSRLSKAREAWERALLDIEDHRTWARNPHWLGENLHHGVAAAWLAHGDPHEAQRVLETLDAELVQHSRELFELSQRVAHGIEVDALGDAVYPPSVSMAERWRAPRVLAESIADGTPLSQWWPGRVVNASAEGVAVVLADPEHRALFDQSFTREEWERAASTPARSAAGYFELGRYGDRLHLARVPMRDEDSRPVEFAETPYLDRLE